MTDVYAAATRPNRSISAIAALVIVLAIAFTALSAVQAHAITRDQVLARAQVRIDAPVPYSQLKYYAGYRTDCSGYVSMCWSTGTSWNTRTFYKVTTPIAASQLQPGDAMLKAGYHIRLFYAWLDDAHTEYIAYETKDGIVSGVRIHSLAEDLSYGYIPVRYDGISGTAATTLVKNGSFDTWAKSWSVSADRPVWWEVEGDSSYVVTRRKDSFHTGRNGLKFFNPSADPAKYTELSQTVPVLAGATYRLTAWGATSFDPSRVTLRLEYLDAAGNSLAETSTAGNTAGLIGAAYKPIAVQSASPVGAVRAVVAVRLAGGVNPESAVTTGTAMGLDDITLVRPAVTVSIKPSTTVAYTGTTVTLSGSVTPTSSVGAPVILYIKKPGGTWVALATSKVLASGDTATWKGTYAFTSAMPRGTYQFMTNVSGVSGYLSKTSSSVSVTLK